MISVRYTGQLKNALGVGGDEFACDGAMSLPALIDAIVERHPPARSLLHDAGGEVQSALVLMADGAQVTSAPRSTRVEPGTELTLLLPYSGG